MLNPKVAVVGSHSMVGSRFCDLASPFLNLIKVDQGGPTSIDITSKISVSNFFASHDFEWLILFSAFTDVDAAENQRGDKNGSCWQVNVEGVKNILHASKENNRKLLLISTDFVFDGEAGPYGEEDSVAGNQSKTSWYGITKAEAERITRNSELEYLILRISYPYRSKFKKKDDIVKKILRLYNSGKLYPMFYDQQITPTLIDDLADTTKLLIEKKQTGVFHLASPKLTNQYEFAKYIVSKSGGNKSEVKKGSLAGFLQGKKATPRPVKGGLKVEKLQNIGFKPTDWKTGVDKIFSESEGKLL